MFARRLRETLFIPAQYCVLYNSVVGYPGEQVVTEGAKQCPCWTGTAQTQWKTSSVTDAVGELGREVMSDSRTGYHGWRVTGGPRLLLSEPATGLITSMDLQWTEIETEKELVIQGQQQQLPELS